MSQITSVPPYLFVGGFVGAAVLVTAVVAVPRLGAASLIAALIVGQLIGAMILDHFGLLGLQDTPMTPIRLGGAILLVIGMGLVLR
jgi:transporter family-2 protein